MYYITPPPPGCRPIHQMLDTPVRIQTTMLCLSLMTFRWIYYISPSMVEVIQYQLTWLHGAERSGYSITDLPAWRLKGILDFIPCSIFFNTVSDSF